MTPEPMTTGGPTDDDELGDAALSGVPIYETPVTLNREQSAEFRKMLNSPPTPTTPPPAAVPEPTVRAYDRYIDEKELRAQLEAAEAKLAAAEKERDEALAAVRQRIEDIAPSKEDLDRFREFVGKAPSENVMLREELTALRTRLGEYREALEIIRDNKDVQNHWVLDRSTEANWDYENPLKFKGAELFGLSVKELCILALAPEPTDG